VFADSGNNPKINVMKRSIFLLLSLLLIGGITMQAQGGRGAKKSKRGQTAVVTGENKPVEVATATPTTAVAEPMPLTTGTSATPVEATPAVIATTGGRELPAVTLQDLDMKKISSADFANDGKPIVISFWATWCKPCIQELIAIQDSYDDLVEETGFKLIAISIDDARNAAKVRPFVEGRAWDYEVYLDVNQDFKRALNVNNVPHTFLLDGNRMIVWDHNSYSPGDEEHLFELVRTLAAGKPLEDGH